MVLPAFKVDDHSSFVMNSLQAQGHPTLRYLIQWATIALGNLKAWDFFSPQQTAGPSAKKLGWQAGIKLDSLLTETCLVGKFENVPVFCQKIC